MVILMKKMMKEFKEFISRGNVIDLAVGVIIGAAFGKIVTSLVNDIIMPVIGILFGGLDLTGLKFELKDVSVNYGTFIQNIIDFLIVAACIFVLVKVVNKLTNLRKKEKEEEKKKEEPKKPDQVLLLEEIKEELVKLNNSK